MKITSCCMILYLFFACSAPPENKKIPADVESDITENNMRSYLIHAATAITDAPMGVNTLSEWERARPERYREFLEMMGIDHLMMEKQRTPLHTTVTGSVQKKGYHIEKLYFESLPGLYVRANLYLPDDGQAKHPTILYLSGHAEDQKGKYQDHPIKFAQLGFVCMITETIQFGEVRGEHWGPVRNGWFNWYSRGYNPGGVEIWNAVRALDVLSQRPEVDTARMGVTGISGGGSQSWYVAAADPRVKASAPVCGGGTLKDHVLNRTVDGHCDCMMPMNTYLQDYKNIGALIAPRPLLIAQADRDGMYRIEAVRELATQVKEAYKWYGKEQNVSLVETPGGHSYHQISREHIFSFFLKQLMNKTVTPEEAGDIDTTGQYRATYEELKVYTSGPPAGDRTTTIQHTFLPKANYPAIASAEALGILKDSVKNFLRKKTFAAFPAQSSSFAPVKEFMSMDSKTSGNTIYSFVSEEGWRLKVDVHWNKDAAAKKPLMIILRNYDEAQWSSEAFSSMIDSTWNIAYFEVRGVGETGWDPALQWHVRRAAAWTGRTLASMQVYDVLRCLEFCRSLPNVDSNSIGIAAQQDMGAVALYAALVDGRCSKVVVNDPPATQDVGGTKDGKGPAMEMLNCLQVTDVNQLPALLLPTQTTLLGKVPATYAWSQQLIKRFEGLVH